MCVGSLFKSPSPPPAPAKIPVQPPLKTPPPPRDIPTPTEIKDVTEEEDITKGKKKTKLKIDKIRKGVKEFGAISGDVPSTPPQGITSPTSTE